jgi:hypothetical protein
MLPIRRVKPLALTWLPRLLFGAVLIVLPGRQIRAQVETVTAGIPSEVKLHVTIKGGNREFRLGEVIPLELSFVSQIPKQYQINMAAYDRSGRMSYEQFVVKPDGAWRDPLHSYFNSIGGWLGGGLTNLNFFSETPTIISLDLNEWVQFSAPGKYRITVISSRVGSPTPFDKPLTLTSNELELAIVSPTDKWQRATLEQAVAILDAPIRQTERDLSDQNRSKHDAIKTVRYLGTRAAANQLARHLRGDDNNLDFEYMFGLIGSPSRETALVETRRLLSDPDHPVTDIFLTTMSVLSVNPDESPEAMRAQFERSSNTIRSELLDTLPKKRGNALAVSLFTTVNQISPQASVPESTRQLMVAQLAKMFDSLSIERQIELLQYRWDSIRSAKLLPVLQKYAQAYQEFPIPNEMHAYNFNQLSGAALQHWYELDPEGARLAVIQEILRPKPRFDARTLGFLPDKTLPEVEELLIEHFSDVADQGGDYWFSGNLASLIERYGTAAILPRMLTIADKNVGKWACMIQGPALAYLLRVDPASARQRIETAMAARGEGYSACNHSLLSDVGSLHLDPLLEEIAIRSLIDGDPEVAANAAGFLGRFGSPAAEQRLWERFTQWSAQWHGRESELQYVNGTENRNLYQGGLGTSLQQAIFSGEAWLTDKPKLQRLRQLSAGPSMQQQVDGIIAQWDPKPWRIDFVPSTDSQFNLLQYNLKSLELLEKKLSQFPSGSSFIWSEALAVPSSNGAKVSAELSEFLLGRGMTLHQQTPPSP